MSRKIRENILVTYGNQGLYPAGQPVYDATNTSGTGPTVLVAPGQAVIYDPSTNLSVNPATWNKKNNGRFVLGVGYDGLGHGYSTAIRKNFGDIMYGCHMQSVLADCSACGLQSVTDVFMNGCFNLDEGVSFNIKVTDLDTVYEFDQNYGAVYNFPVMIPSDVCKQCDETFDCTKFINSVWQQVRPYEKRPDRRYATRRQFPKQELPFDIVTLYTTSYTYTLTTADSSCEKCAYIQGLTSLVIDGTPLVFTNNRVNTNFTSFGQLGVIIHQINKALDGKGAAILRKDTGDCCGVKIEINTCKVVGNLNVVDDEGTAGTVAPVTSSPLATITLPAEASYLCNNPDGTLTPTCGFRIIGKPIEFTHECFINLALPRYLARRIEVVGGNFNKDFPFYVKEIQAPTFPKGLGIYWALREYKSDNGGSGRTHSPENSKYGILGLPGLKDRINSVVVDPAVSYDSVVIEHSYVDVPLSHIGGMNQLNGTTVLLVPSSDNATKTALESAINFYITQGDCNALPAIDFCTP